MKTVKINLYTLNELDGYSREIAISEHKYFLDNEEIEAENENGEMEYYYHDHEENEVIESIEINGYLYFKNGQIAPCTTYTGKHPKSGITELNLEGEIYTL